MGSQGSPSRTGNVVGFGENIINLFKNNVLRRQLGENAREYIKENLSWDKVAMSVEKINFDIITDLSSAVRLKA